MCNLTATEGDVVCAGIGQCTAIPDSLEGECTCPKGHSVLTDCELTHFGVEPTLAFVVAAVFLVPCVLFMLLTTYEYMWAWKRRPQMRWSLLQLFKLDILFFGITRVWGSIHYMVNSQIGHEKIWLSPLRELTSVAGFCAMLVALALVASLCYDMMDSIQNVDLKKSRSGRNVRLGMIVGGVITTIVLLANAIYSLFLKPQWLGLVSTGVAALYALSFLTITLIVVIRSRKFWYRKSGNGKAASEFSRKMKIMIGWIVGVFCYVIAAAVSNIISYKASSLYFFNFALFYFIELYMACLTLAFNQHYLHPFRGFGCLGEDVSFSSGSSPGNRNKPSSSSSDRFTINSQTKETRSPRGHSDSGSLSELTFSGSESGGGSLKLSVSSSVVGVRNESESDSESVSDKSEKSEDDSMSSVTISSK